MKTIGIDIGGTKIHAAIVNNGQIEDDIINIKTAPNSEDILKSVLESIEKLPKNNIKAVGIATAGTVNIEGTRVTGSTANLPEGYKNIDFPLEIEKRFGLKTILENDANAAAYAEYKLGSAKGHKNTITITLGTGIGGGIIVDGKLLKGTTGGAAEVGHIQISFDKTRSCTCGIYGCFEAYASGTGYLRTAKEILKKCASEKVLFCEESLKDICDAIKQESWNIDTITTYEIIERLKENSRFSSYIHNLWHEHILAGLTALTNIFEPESIVISGGMADACDLGFLQKELDKRVIISKTKILKASMGNYAGLIGAALLADETFKVS